MDHCIYCGHKCVTDHIVCNDCGAVIVIEEWIEEATE